MALHLFLYPHLSCICASCSFFLSLLYCRSTYLSSPLFGVLSKTSKTAQAQAVLVERGGGGDLIFPFLLMSKVAEVDEEVGRGVDFFSSFN